MKCAKCGKINNTPYCLSCGFNSNSYFREVAANEYKQYKLLLNSYWGSKGFDNQQLAKSIEETKTLLDKAVQEFEGIKKSKGYIKQITPDKKIRWIISPQTKKLRTEKIETSRTTKQTKECKIECPICNKQYRSESITDGYCPNCYCNLDQYGKAIAPELYDRLQHWKYLENPFAVVMLLTPFFAFIFTPALFLMGFFPISLTLIIISIGAYVIVYWFTWAENKKKNIRISRKKLYSKLEAFESNQKALGLQKYWTANKTLRWGNPQQIRNWKIIESDIKNNFVNLSPRQFEKLIESLFKKMGYITHLTSQTCDYGTDVIAKRGSDVIVIEVKKYSENNNVGNRAIQRLLGSMYNYGANKAIFVTSSDFTSNAYHQAKKAPIELWNGNKLNRMLEKYYF